MSHHTEAERALSNLRHLYQQMAGGAVKDSAQAKRIAEGLLSPAIEKLERAARRAPAVPQGCKLVPISPTQEQLRAGYWSGGGEIRLHEEWARKESYERMVQNAPMTSPTSAPQPPEAAA